MKVTATQIKGLLPSLDSRRVNSPHIIDGSNFMVGIDGPSSSFASTEIFDKALALPEFFQSFRTDAQTDSWFFLREGIFKPDLESGNLIPVFLYGGYDTTYYYPTTHDIVGGKHYFANPFIGLVQYDPLADSWTSISGGSVPSGIVTCVQVGARLVVVAPGIIAWSSIDDGTDFVPSTSTGAGFQSLSIVGSSAWQDIIGIYRTVQGFLVFTKSGTVQGKLLTGIVPFSVKPIKFRRFPINPWAVTQYTNDTLIFLSDQGLFMTDGTKLEPFNEILGNFMRDEVLPNLSFSGEGFVALEYISSLNWLFIMFSQSGTRGYYDRAYVVDMQTQEIGVFDKTFTGICELVFSDSIYKGLNAGYVDIEGSVFVFTRNNVTLEVKQVSDMTFGEEYYLRQYDEYPPRVEAGVYNMPSTMYMYTHDMSELLLNDLDPGVYDFFAELEDADGEYFGLYPWSESIRDTFTQGIIWFANGRNELYYSNDFTNPIWDAFLGSYQATVTPGSLGTSGLFSNIADTNSSPQAIVQSRDIGIRADEDPSVFVRIAKDAVPATDRMVTVILHAYDYLSGGSSTDVEFVVALDTSTGSFVTGPDINFGFGFQGPGEASVTSGSFDGVACWELRLRMQRRHPAPNYFAVTLYPSFVYYTGSSYEVSPTLTYSCDISTFALIIGAPGLATINTDTIIDPPVNFSGLIYVDSKGAATIPAGQQFTVEGSSLTYTVTGSAAGSYLGIGWLQHTPNLESFITYSPRETEIYPENFLVASVDLHMESGVILYGIAFSDQEQKALDSYVKIGLLSGGDDSDIDQMSQVTGVSVGMLESRTSANLDSQTEDWLANSTVEVIEDWLTISPDVFEDWGFQLSAGSEYTLVLESSLDGYSSIDGMSNELQLVLSDGKTARFDADQVGKYHSLIFSAFNVGESLSIKVVDTNMVPAGVMV